MNEDVFSSNMVLVTGASGYIALHCVEQLLQAGYSVRGTVRSLHNKAKVNPLRDLEYGSERLELVEADLECPEHWPSVCDGCDYILHVASPWPIVADEKVIGVAVNGTINVLKAAATYRRIKKIVLTSSCSAVNDGYRNDARVFDEKCWSDLTSERIENYGRSKTLAEKAAWEFWSKLDESNRFQLTVLNPTFVVGPVLSDQGHGSATIISRMMSYKTYLAAPKVSLGMVDVRDVATAHIRAMTTPETNGERILITSTPSVCITPVVAPNWMFRLYIKTKLDPQAEAIKHRLGPEIIFDNSLSVKLLKMRYREPRKSIIEMVYSMIDHGMIKKSSKLRSKPSKRKNNKCVVA
ncbi:unnamed protein product [Enterobius vermicularis]|uniref:Epimerase domain-containing protein n=1 Tax=Enterobius vermicularis TaxID=51028 RepID=A0A0N4V2B1_ENTVE|nr:unnamed protein product [Enterobius vermicularis]